MVGKKSERKLARKPWVLTPTFRREISKRQATFITLQSNRNTEKFKRSRVRGESRSSSGRERRKPSRFEAVHTLKFCGCAILRDVSSSYNKVSSYLIGSATRAWKSVSPCIMVITRY